MADEAATGIKDWANLIGGLIKTGGQVSETITTNDAARSAQKQQMDQYARLAAEAKDPKLIFQKVMALKKNMSDEQKKMLVQSVAGQMVAGGSAGATGLIQEAVAEALLRSDAQLFDQAMQAYAAASAAPGRVLTSASPAKGSQLQNPFSGISSLTDSIQKLLKPSTPATPALPSAEDTFSSFSANQPSVGDGG
jgi:hypothetical protein